jgi:hypothetical protein
MTASRTTPTLCVLVIMTGPFEKTGLLDPGAPVISPLPFCANQPGEHRIGERIAAARQDRRDPGAHRPDAHLQFPRPEISVV